MIFRKLTNMKTQLNEGDKFGQRLKRIRFEKGLTQIELSRLSGITNVQIARYEKNTAQPTMMVIRKLSKALEMEVDELAVDIFKPSFDIGELDVTIDRMKQLPPDDILVIKEVMDRFIESRNVRAALLK